MRIRVTPHGPYLYPEIVVVCGEPQFADQRTDTLLNPILIVEVLSPSTEAYDRGLKFSHYRGLPSLEEYVLVTQGDARVEIFRRQANDQWLLSEVVGLELSCVLGSIACDIPMVEIYDKAVLDAA